MVLYLLFLYPLMGLQSGFLVGDYGSQFYPWLSAYAVALKQGYLLLWTPLIQSGFPLFAEGQTAMLYPFNLLFFGFLPFKLAYNLIFLTHFALAGFGAYRFGLKKGMSAAAATLTALSFTFGSAAGGSFYGMYGFRGLAWFPWTLCLVEDFVLRSEDRRPLFWLAILQALAWLTGPQMALYQGLFLTLYYVLRTGQVAHSASWKEWIRNASWFLAALILSLVIAIPQIWATLQLASHSSRSLQEADFVLWGSVAPWSLGVLFFYTWNGLLRCSLYIGCLPLLFIWAKPLWKQAGIWWLLVFISLLMSLGRFNPLYLLLSKLPIFSLLRNPSKFVFFTAFFLCMIAGLSFDFWIKRYEEDRRSLALFFKKAMFFAGGAVLTAGGALLLVHRGSSFLENFGRWYTTHFVIGKSYHRASAAVYMSSVQEMLARLKAEINFSNLLFWLPFAVLTATLMILFLAFRRGVRPSILCWLTLSLLCADLFIYGKLARGVSWENIAKFEEATPPGLYSTDGKWIHVGASRFQKLWPNKNMLLGVASPGVYAPLLDKDYYLLTKDFGALDDSFRPSELNMEAFTRDRQLVDFMGIRYILAGSHDLLPGFRLESRNLQESLYVNDRAMPEFSFESVAGPSRTKGIKVLKNTATFSQIEVDANVSGALLRNQVFDKGWKVSIDGQEAILQKKRGAFQGVDIPSGRHRVNFSFEPAYWILGRWAALAGWAIALAGLFLTASARKRKC